ncbi:hypothetical protein PLCT2_00534 [Planctomycetaceae bacterium]|nr:hypothetical protein PLCT2_00534 [Planctomycetaceae bacterium]
MRHAAYQLMLPSVRGILHAQAARILERVHGGKDSHALDAFAAEICDHLRVALTQRMGAAKRRSLSARFHELLGNAARHAERQFQYAAALVLWKERANLAGGDARSKVAALSRAGLMATWLFDLPQARKLARSQLAQSRAIGDARLVAGALSDLARIEFLRRNLPRSRALYEKALRHAGDNADPLFLGKLLCNWAVAEHQLGKLDAARVLFERAELIQRRNNDVGGIAATLLNFANLEIDARHSAEFERLCQAAIPMLRQAGDVRGEGYALGNLGQHFFETNRAEQGASLLGLALELHHRVSNFEQEGWVAAYLCGRWMAAGKLIDAAQAAQRAIRALEQTANREWLGAAWSKLAVIHFKTGQRVLAEHAAASAELALRGSRTVGSESYRNEIAKAREQASKSPTLLP